MAKSTPKAPESYESAAKELEGLIASLEQGKLPLEAAIEAYQRGAALLQYCRQQLSDAEQRIQVLEGNSLQDFQGNAQSE